MKTIFSIGVLVVMGFVANFVWVLIGNLAGLPGAVLGGLAQSRAAWRVRLGITVAFLGQAYVGLAYAAGVAAWTRLAAGRPDVFGPIVWPVAFLVVAGPMWVALIRARIEAQEEGSGERRPS